MAWYLASRPLPPRFKHLFWSAAMILLPAALITMQNDTGTAIMVAMSGVFVVLLAGIRWRIVMAGFIALLVASPAWYLFLTQEHQKNRILTSIKNASVKKILGELQNLKKDKEKYDSFYTGFRRPLKEGVYQDFSNRDTLIELLQFKSTKTEGFTGLAEYKDRMNPEQKAIYYITGENEQNLKNSPLLEAYKDKDIEVLIMDDDIDEIVTPSIGKYRDIELISVNRSDAADELKSDEDKESEKKIEPLIKKIKKVLGNDVKDVRASTRLSDSPSCIVADEKDPTIQMQHLLRSMGQSDIPEIKPVLEINPGHEIVRKLVNTENSETIEDVSRLLLEQALLLEGAELEDPSSFVKRLNRVLTRSL